jgi:hypothetical protein
MIKVVICIISSKYSSQENENFFLTCHIKFKETMKNADNFHEDLDSYLNTNPTNNTNLTKEK